MANALLAVGALDRTAIGAVLDEAGIDGQRRPETLAIRELVAVADAAFRLTDGRRAVL